MRKDMPKVITERPRRGGGLKTPKSIKRRTQRVDNQQVLVGSDVHNDDYRDEHERGEKIRAKWDRSNCEKNFTDVLGPLKGWVRKQIGRPWAKVSSEIDAVLKATGGVSYTHARGHLFDYLETQVVEIDGEPCYATGYSCGTPLKGWGQAIAYVCPRTGILKKCPGAGRSFRSTFNHNPDSPLTHKNGKVYAQICGFWFQLTLKSIPEAAFDNNYHWHWNIRKHPGVLLHDVYFDKTLGDVQHEKLLRYYKSSSYCVNKKQLNAREIKKLGLNVNIRPLPNIVRPKKRK